MLARRGDTMVEVMIAITIYSVVALFTISAMRLGINQGETSLELSQARIEISAQADAIRFIHNSFLAEREYNVEPSDSYKALWNYIASKAVDSTVNIGQLSTNTCPGSVSNSFIINTRKIDLTTPSNTVITGAYVATQLYPRVIYSGSDSDDSDQHYVDKGTYKNLSRAEGIWIIARKSATKSTLYNNQPEYYDFHIYTCWYPPNSSRPSTTGTIIRLYNPYLKEAGR